MKLFYCLECSDTVSLTYAWRSCKCGASRARYNAKDRADADSREDYIGLYEGSCVPFAIGNETFSEAVECWLETGDSTPALCFTIAESDTGRIKYTPHIKR